MNATQTVIRFENVRMGFAGEEVLRGVSLEVAPQETVVLAGETGTGKTLLLKLAAGLLRPTAGRVFVLGHEVSSLPERELLPIRRAIGFVFQEGALFDSLSVAENVAFRLREEGTAEEEIVERVRQALRFVEMEHAYELLPGELSGGMRRRVAIARAIITNPPVVLYDSPTAGLDPVTAQTIIALILRLRDLHHVSALLATHRIQDAFALANFAFDPEANRIVSRPAAGPNGGARTSVAVLRDGRIAFQGDQHALAGASDPYIRQFLV